MFDSEDEDMPHNYPSPGNQDILMSVDTATEVSNEDILMSGMNLCDVLLTQMRKYLFLLDHGSKGKEPEILQDLHFHDQAIYENEIFVQGTILLCYFLLSRFRICC